MKREYCSGCGAGALDMFLDLGTSPIADAYTDSPDDNVQRHPLQVAVCVKCHLVQLLEVVDPKVLFNDGYSFYSSDSPPLVAYHRRYAEDLLARFPDEAESGVLEVGCNDGDLLRHFSHLPHLGVDPTGGPTARAAERGLDVVNEPFSLALAQGLGRRFGVIIANHVLAHVVDASDVLAGISDLLLPGGVALIEVQYLPDLLVNNAFDLVYHEHRNFFSLTTLNRAAELQGLHVADAQLTDRQGGSLRVTLRKHGWLNGDLRDIPRSETWLNDLSAYAGVQGRVERIRTRLQDLVTQERYAGRIVAGYGAPAKATTLLNFCQLGSSSIEFIMDPAPSKIGRYIPGTDIQIVAPDSTMINPDATVLLLIWNYASAIMRQYETFMTGGGRWIIPFPAPTLL
jgi:SAM-dependent methyltransferase